MDQKLKDEIYEYVSKIDLSEEELAQIDIYVNELVTNLLPLLESQKKVIEDKKAFSQFKEMLLKHLGD